MRNLGRVAHAVERVDGSKLPFDGFRLLLCEIGVAQSTVEDVGREYGGYKQGNEEGRGLPLAGATIGRTVGEPVTDGGSSCNER